jgi:uncharacterized damage-inducible protein DinB
MDPLKIYDYLTQTRQRYMDAVRCLSPQQYQHTFTFGLKTFGSTLTHLMVSEWYYIQRLDGRAVPHYNQWPIKYEHPPAFDVIERTWREQAKSVRASIAANQRDWSRQITWLSFPDDLRGNKQFHITCTAGDLITQLAFHEIHHRAQIMVMLRLAGAPSLQDIDYNALMFQRVEAAT